MPTLEEFLGPLEDEFERRLRAFVAASGGTISLSSGYRSVEHQQELWCNKARSFGYTGNCDPSYMAANAPDMHAKVRKWVAVPGHSNHQRGVAADLTYANNAALEWAHNNASRFGLVFPLGHENWHIEPIGLRAGTYEGEPFDIGEPIGEFAYTIDDRELTPEEIAAENTRAVFRAITGSFHGRTGRPGFGTPPEPDGIPEVGLPEQDLAFTPMVDDQGIAAPPPPLEAPFNDGGGESTWEGEPPPPADHPADDDPERGHLA